MNVESKKWTRKLLALPLGSTNTSKHIFPLPFQISSILVVNNKIVFEQLMLCVCVLGVGSQRRRVGAVCGEVCGESGKFGIVVIAGQRSWWPVVIAQWWRMTRWFGGTLGLIIRRWLVVDLFVWWPTDHRLWPISHPKMSLFVNHHRYRSVWIGELWHRISLYSFDLPSSRYSSLFTIRNEKFASRSCFSNLPPHTSHRRGGKWSPESCTIVPDWCIVDTVVVENVPDSSQSPTGHPVEFDEYSPVSAPISQWPQCLSERILLNRELQSKGVPLGRILLGTKSISANNGIPRVRLIGGVSSSVYMIRISLIALFPSAINFNYRSKQKKIAKLFTYWHRSDDQRPARRWNGPRWWPEKWRERKQISTLWNQTIIGQKKKRDKLTVWNSFDRTFTGSVPHGENPEWKQRRQLNN